MHKSATAQAAVLSGRKIGQKPQEKQQQKKRESHKISSLFQTDNQGSKLEPSRESGGKNTHVKAAESVEMSVEIHLLFPTLHQLSANGEKMTLESQTEQQKGKAECIHPQTFS